MIIANEDTNERIRKMIRLLVDILNSDIPIIGASAMVDLLVNNAISSGCTKEAWLKDFSDAWDFYEKEQNTTAEPTP